MGWLDCPCSPRVPTTRSYPTFFNDEEAGTARPKPPERREGVLPTPPQATRPSDRNGGGLFPTLSAGNNGPWHLIECAVEFKAPISVAPAQA